MDEVKDVLEETLLTLDLLEELYDEYEEQNEVTIKVKTSKGYIDTKIFIDKAFKPRKIQKCVSELVSKIKMANAYMSKNADGSSVYQMWFILMLIKYFTSLEIPNDFKKQVAVMEKMMESEIFFQIFAEFEKEEIDKVMKEAENISLVLQEKVEAYQPVFEEVQNNMTSE